MKGFTGGVRSCARGIFLPFHLQSNPRMGEQGGCQGRPPLPRHALPVRGVSIAPQVLEELWLGVGWFRNAGNRLELSGRAFFQQYFHLHSPKASSKRTDRLVQSAGTTPAGRRGQPPAAAPCRRKRLPVSPAGTQLPLAPRSTGRVGMEGTQG